MTPGISATVRNSPPPHPLHHIMFPVFLSSTLKRQWQSRGSCMGFQVWGLLCAMSAIFRQCELFVSQLSVSPCFSVWHGHENNSFSTSKYQSYSQRYQGVIVSSVGKIFTFYNCLGNQLLSGSFFWECFIPQIIQLPVRTTWRRLLSSDPPSVSTTWWGVTKTGLLWWSFGCFFFWNFHAKHGDLPDALQCRWKDQKIRWCLRHSRLW